MIIDIHTRHRNNISKIIKSHKDLMMSSIVPCNVKKEITEGS